MKAKKRKKKSLKTLQRILKQTRKASEEAFRRRQKGLSVSKALSKKATKHRKSIRDLAIEHWRREGGQWQKPREVDETGQFVE